MPDPLAGVSPDTSTLPPGAIAAPDMSQAPVAAPTSPMAAPQAQPPQGATPDQNHSLIGRVVRHFASALEGKQINYQPDPTTGEVQEVVTPRRPGGVFRDIVLGALAGGAAGATAPNRQSALGGAALGGATVAQQQQAQQQRQQQLALEKAQRLKNLADAKAQQKKADDIQAQTTALGNISVLTHDHMANLHDPKQVDSYNNSSQIVLSALKDKAGARPAQILGPDGTDLNAKPDNGGDLLAMFQKNPESVMKAPDGWHRSVITTVDTKGLTQKNGQWVDEAGKPVDLADRTTFHLLDIPASKWGQSLTLTKGSINDVAGAKIMPGNETDTGTTTVGQMMALRLKSIQDLNKDIADTYPSLDENKYASLKAQAQGILSDPDSTQSQKDKAQKQLTYADNWFKAHGDVKLADKDKPDSSPFPVLKEGDAAGFLVQAQQALKNAKTPEEQKQAQQQIQYAQQSIRTLQQTAANLAAAKKGAEVATELKAVDGAAVGPKDLPQELNARFNALPDGVRGQLAGTRTRDIAALFAMADGDVGKNSFPARVYKGSNQLAQSDAVGLVKQINPNWDEKLYNSKQRLVNNYTDSKKEGGQIETFNNFLNHAADASDVVRLWDKQRAATGVPWVNTPLNELRDKLKGDSLLSRYEAALEPVRKEYMSFLNANRAEHTEDLEVMKRVLDPSRTPAQNEVDLKQLSKTAVLRLDSLNENWKTVTGGNYPNLVTPKGKVAAAKLGLGDAIASYGSGGSLSAASTRQTPQAAPPVNLLKEGTHTKFQNGQTWTLQNGQPVQVQ